MKIYNGIHAVLYALFDAQGRLDREAMRTQTQLMLNEGVDGCTILGLATEVQKLSTKEQRDCIAWLAEDLADTLPFSVTISGNSVAAQRGLAQCALDHGADWLILQPPIVGNYSGEVYLDFFSAVARGFDAPFAIQNAPQYLGRSLAREDINRLQQNNPNFSLIKAEISAVALASLRHSTQNTMTILNGRGGLEMTDCLRAGADGFVLAPDSIDFSKRIYDHWQRGEYEAAETVYSQALPAMVFMMQSIEHLICYGKRIFGLRAGITIHDRTPAMTPLPFGLELSQHWAERLGKFETTT